MTVILGATIACNRSDRECGRCLQADKSHKQEGKGWLTIQYQLQNKLAGITLSADQCCLSFL